MAGQADDVGAPVRSARIQIRILLYLILHYEYIMQNSPVENSKASDENLSEIYDAEEYSTTVENSKVTPSSPFEQLELPKMESLDLDLLFGEVSIKCEFFDYRSVRF